MVFEQWFHCSDHALRQGAYVDWRAADCVLLRQPRKIEQGVNKLVQAASLFNAALNRALVALAPCMRFREPALNDLQVTKQ